MSQECGQLGMEACTRIHRSTENVDGSCLNECLQRDTEEIIESWWYCFRDALPASGLPSSICTSMVHY